MRLLFIHQNLPGQYRHLLQHYGQSAKCEVVGLGDARRLESNFPQPLPGVRLFGYTVGEHAGDLRVPRLAATTVSAIDRGHAVAVALHRLKKAGFVPDVICGHPGWGEMMFVRDVFPGARIINFCEFYYGAQGRDFGFDAEFPSSALDGLGLRSRNLHHLMALEQADVGIAPTHWQKHVFPEVFHSKIEVVHDGIDTRVVTPHASAFLHLAVDDITLTAESEVITFVSRNLEPYRGFHVFMRSIPELLRRRPNAHVIVVGGDDVSYGSRLPEGTYRAKYLADIAGAYDEKRVHFVGRVSYANYLRVLQVSTAHVYLTYPFVLSWSMLEAMAAGCVVVGSRTAPVEEVIEDGSNGRLIDFFSTDALIDAVADACAHRGQYNAMRKAARQTVIDQFDLTTRCLPAQAALIEAQA